MLFALLLRFFELANLCLVLASLFLGVCSGFEALELYTHDPSEFRFYKMLGSALENLASPV